MRIPLALVCSVAIICTPGCGSLALKQKQRQMELVARDWAMTIRASQVVPVYPLSQDILPGDVFLVNRTVADQSQRFRERGFMPTDLQVARLAPDDYASFYNQWHEDSGSPESASSDSLILPRDWRDAPATTSPWGQFPKVGFPSYSFDVSNSGGMSIAIPVQSVPLALSITGAASATGTVTMSDAVTYGIDAPSLYEQLDQARKSGQLDHALPPEGKGPWYLRVVTRVFAAKTFDVVLTSRSTLGGGGDIGSPQAVRDAGGQLETGQTVGQINDQLEALRSQPAGVSAALPGASVRATFASGRTIGLRETFVEPIVIGYHGFDVAIDHTGELGPIVPTFQVLEDGATPQAPTAISVDDSAYLAILTVLRAIPVDKARMALAKAASHNDDLQRAFEAAMEERPSKPVSAWVKATQAISNTTRKRRQLHSWLSLGIREALEE